MKLLLTHGYFLEEDPLEKEIMRPYPPLGILSISAYLTESGIDNHVFDSTFKRFNDLTSFIIKNQPQYIAIYSNLMTKLNVVKLVSFIQSITDFPIPKVIIGGPDVTYNVDNYLNTGADVIVIGEGEQTMQELICALDSSDGKSCLRVDGIAYLDTNNDVVKTKSRAKLKDVNELPVPARDRIDLQQYLDVWKKYHGSSTVSVSTQRGCPYTCAWCSTAVYGQSYRRRSPENTVKELLSIKNTYNQDAIWFVDDVFTVSHKWLREFNEEVNKHHLSLKYECITRADRMNEEVIQLLKESGCFRVWIGAESGSQKIIDEMDRRVDVKQVREMIQLCNQAGIETGTFIMLGYPKETYEDIKETIHHLKVSNPTYFTITIAYPIKGTRLHDDIQNEITNELDWNTSTDRQIEFKRMYSRKFYDYAVRLVYNEVNYHKSKINRELGLKLLKFKTKSLLLHLMMWYERTLNN